MRTPSAPASTCVSDLDVAASGDDLYVTWLGGRDANGNGKVACAQSK